MNPTLEIRILLEESRPSLIEAIQEAVAAKDTETLTELREIRERLDRVIDRLHARIVAELSAEDVREELAIARWEQERQEGWH